MRLGSVAPNWPNTPHGLRGPALSAVAIHPSPPLPSLAQPAMFLSSSFPSVLSAFTLGLGDRGALLRFSADEWWAFEYISWQEADLWA